MKISFDIYDSSISNASGNSSNPSWPPKCSSVRFKIDDMQPIIRWAGSKRQLLPELRAYWPKSANRYIEPFCGSACLFFDLEPKEAILGDLNGELISTYRAVRNDPSLVVQCYKRLRKGKLSYYRIRAESPKDLTEAEIAARFLYLNRFCFNGIYRTNLNGDFNVPFGDTKGTKDLNIQTLASAAQLLKNATLLNGDFQLTISRAEEGDFVYLDPPYALKERRVFSEYGPSPFITDDLERLRESLEILDSKNVTFVISYADCREARALLEKWNPKRVWTKRHIAGFANHRRGAYEIMASNKII